MKKTSIARAAVALTLALSSVAHAGAAFCPVVEFAELQTYTKEELMAMWSENFNKTQAAGINRPIEVENCVAQNSRILRALKIKREAQATAPVK